MGYQRSKWHSGLTYKQVCETCKSTVTYTDYVLDFRPWYPDGFVDCPTCKTHLRHHEKFAVTAETAMRAVPAQATAPSQQFTSLFCNNCGKKFEEDHRFCTQCGSKRI